MLTVNVKIHILGVAPKFPQTIKNIERSSSSSSFYDQKIPNETV